jgi:glycosyltransferase involved in cell wall biosynthesis
MRVVHLEAGRHLYGGAQQAAYLIRGLAQQGVENILLCPKDSAISHAELPADVVELDIRGDLDLSLLRRLREAAAAIGPDILHVHSRRGADVFGGFSVRGTATAAVLTRRVESPEPRFWARCKYRPYARIIAISNAIRRELVDGAGLEASRIVLVPSAVDTERYRPSGARGRLGAAFGLPAGARVLGCAAQLIARKGHASLLRSFVRLAAKYRDLYLLCFGEGPLRRRLERRAAALGVAERVAFVGFRSDLADLLPEVDVLVHPAQREGLGSAVLEAMSAGVPVVACAAGGLVDLVEDGVTGLLVPPRDATALADAVVRLLGDAALRTRLADRGRQAAVSRFSIARMVEGNLAVYRQVRREHDEHGG